MVNGKSHAKRWLIVGGIILLLVIFVLLVDVAAIVDLLGGTNWPLWLGSVIFLLVGFVFITARWHYLLTAKPNWLHLFQGDSIAYMINMITPIPVMVSRIVTTNLTTPVSIAHGTSAMVVDRLLETMMRVLGFILALVLLASQLADANAYGTILVYLALLALAIVGLIWIRNHDELVTDKLSAWLGRLPRLSEAQVRQVVGNFLQGLTYAGSTRHLVVGLLLSITMWAFFLVFQSLVLVAIPPAPPATDTVLIALAVLVVIPPSTPAMIGLYQAIVIGLLVGLSLMDVNRATTYAILLFLPQLVIWLVLGILALRLNHIEFAQLVQAVRTHSDKDSDTSKSEVSPTN